MFHILPPPSGMMWMLNRQPLARLELASKQIGTLWTCKMGAHAGEKALDYCASLPGHPRIGHGLASYSPTLRDKKLTSRTWFGYPGTKILGKQNH